MNEKQCYPNSLRVLRQAASALSDPRRILATEFDEAKSARDIDEAVKRGLADYGRQEKRPTGAQWRDQLLDLAAAVETSRKGYEGLLKFPELIGPLWALEEPEFHYPKTEIQSTIDLLSTHERWLKLAIEKAKGSVSNASKRLTPEALLVPHLIEVFEKHTGLCAGATTPIGDEDEDPEGWFIDFSVWVVDEAKYPRASKSLAALIADHLRHHRPAFRRHRKGHRPRPFVTAESHFGPIEDTWD